MGNIIIFLLFEYCNADFKLAYLLHGYGIFRDVVMLLLRLLQFLCRIGLGRVLPIALGTAVSVRCMKVAPWSIVTLRPRGAARQKLRLSRQLTISGSEVRGKRY